jgi:thioredoxin 1
MNTMVEEISSEKLKEVITEHKVVFLDCHAVWCGPCRTLSPIIEELQETYKDRGFKAFKIDVDQNRDFSMENQITGVPCVFVYADGQQVVFDDGSGRKLDRLVGVMPPEIYTQIVEGLLAEVGA